MPPEFAEFAGIYERDLRLTLEQKEQERKRALDKAKKTGVIGLAVGIALVVLGLLIFRSPFAVIPGVLVGFGALFFGSSELRKVASGGKDVMVKPVAERFGITYNEEPSPEAETNLHKCRELKVLPSWDRMSLQDEMLGQRNGRHFEFFEAHLEDQRTRTDSEGRTRTEWVTVFRGQCWVLETPKTFLGETRVSRDAGLFNALGGLGSKFNRVRLEDPEFEKLFEVYGTDQVEARFLLTPDVMQAFLDLEEAFKGGRLRCTFSGNRTYVAIEGGNLFEMNAMFKSFDDPERVGDLLEDFAAMFHLVDVLGKK